MVLFVRLGNMSLATIKLATRYYRPQVGMSVTKPPTPPSLPTCMIGGETGCRERKVQCLPKDCCKPLPAK